MTGEQRVFETVSTAAAPLAGRAVALLLPDINSNSVSAYLSMLVEKKKLFSKPNPSAKGKLFCDKPFEVDNLSRTISNPKGNGSAPPPEEVETHAEMIARMRKEYLQRVEDERQGKPKPTPDLTLAEVRRLAVGNAPPQSYPDAVAAFRASTKQPPVFDALPADKFTVEPPAPLVPEDRAFAKRRSFAFPLPTREPVEFSLPADLTAEELITLALMLDAYGQMKRRAA